MKRLSRKIEAKVGLGLWNPLKTSRSGPYISHLFFIDDLTLFVVIDDKNYQTINETLQDFHLRAGQKVNHTKSRTFFSKNCPYSIIARCVNILGIKNYHIFGKYLGFPIFHKRSTNGDFQHIIDNLRNKLAGWKSSTLTMAGRVVLPRIV